MKATILRRLLVALALILVCVGLAGSWAVFDWWLSNGWGGSMDVATARSEFFWTLLLLLLSSTLAGLPPALVSFWHVRESSVRAAREQEAKDKTQAEDKRTLSVTGTDKVGGRRQQQAQVVAAIGRGILAALEQHATELERLAEDIHRARVALNIEHFFWGVEQIAIQILTEEHGREWVLRARAEQRLAEIAARQQTLPSISLNH